MRRLVVCRSIVPHHLLQVNEISFYSNRSQRPRPHRCCLLLNKLRMSTVGKSGHAQVLLPQSAISCGGASGPLTNKWLRQTGSADSRADMLSIFMFGGKLTTWPAMHDHSSMLKGQRSRSQSHVTYRQQNAITQQWRVVSTSSSWKLLSSRDEACNKLSRSVGQTYRKYGGLSACQMQKKSTESVPELPKFRSLSWETWHPQM